MDFSQLPPFSNIMCAQRRSLFIIKFRAMAFKASEKSKTKIGMPERKEETEKTIHPNKYYFRTRS